MAAVYPFSKIPGSTELVGNETIHSQSVNSVQKKSTTLLLRLMLFNVLAFAMLGAAWWEGYVATVIEADQTYLSVLIFVVFIVGLIISIWRATQINREIDLLNALKTSVIPEGGTEHSQLKKLLTEVGQGSMSALRLRLSHRIASIRHIANVLVLLGLIGTVLGFIIALSGVDPESASDIEGIAPMVSTLIQGMSTALYTTLIGSILNVWLSANYQILASGTVELMSQWMEADEHVKASEASTSHA